MLEQVREDSARQVARTKDRCDTIRRNMQAQIGDLEKQLAHCRATAKAAQRDRDEVLLLEIKLFRVTNTGRTYFLAPFWR